MSVPRITKEELKQRLDGAAGEPPVVLDARLKYPYEHSTITLPGAVRLAPDTTAVPQIPLDRGIVVYDSDPDELVAERVAAGLIARGFRAEVLQGGIGDWAGAKLPTDSKPAPQPAATAAATAAKG